MPIWQNNTIILIIFNHQIAIYVVNLNQTINLVEHVEELDVIELSVIYVVKNDMEKIKLVMLSNLRHCFCMFCCRTPGPKVIKRWWDVALTLTRNLLPMDQTKYYAWFVRCNLVKPCGDRACGAGYAPRFQNFECEQCEVDRLEAERILRESELENQSPYNQIKKCPACQVPKIRYAGCNHITCQCGAHWCFECGGEFNPSIIYTHINRADGRIYANEEPEFFEGYE